MEEQATSPEALYEKTKEYVNTNIELAKLKAVDKTSDIVSSVVPPIIVSIFLILFVIVFNMAVSLWLGEILGKAYYGFFVVAGFYLLLVFVVRFGLSSTIKKRVANAIISRLLN